MKEHTVRFWLTWQILLFVAFGGILAFILFSDWYSSMVEHSANPRLTHTVCVLGVLATALGGMFVLKRKIRVAREKVQEGRSQAG